MKSWLTTRVERGVRLARIPFVKWRALDAWMVRGLETWASSWPDLPRRKPKKRRQHGPGWISPKAMMAGIKNELVPAALALGWVLQERWPARKGERRFGEFNFERVAADRIEHLGFDFQYGDDPDVWLCLALWTGEAGVCTLFRTGACWGRSRYGKPLWRRIWRSLRQERPANDPLAEALALGLQRLQIAEAYFKEGAEHPDLGLIPTLPPYQWPDGYADRMR